MLSPILYVKVRGKEEYYVVHSVDPIEVRAIGSDEILSFAAMPSVDWASAELPVLYVQSAHNHKFFEFTSVQRPWVKFVGDGGRACSLHVCDFNYVSHQR